MASNPKIKPRRPTSIGRIQQQASSSQRPQQSRPPGARAGIRAQNAPVTATPQPGYGSSFPAPASRGHTRGGMAHAGASRFGTGTRQGWNRTAGTIQQATRGSPVPLSAGPAFGPGSGNDDIPWGNTAPNAQPPAYMGTRIDNQPPQTPPFSTGPLSSQPPNQMVAGPYGGGHYPGDILRTGPLGQDMGLASQQMLSQGYPTAMQQQGPPQLGDLGGPDTQYSGGVGEPQSGLGGAQVDEDTGGAGQDPLTQETQNAQRLGAELGVSPQRIIDATNAGFQVLGDGTIMGPNFSDPNAPPEVYGNIRDTPVEVLKSMAHERQQAGEEKRRVQRNRDTALNNLSYEPALIDDAQMDEMAMRIRDRAEYVSSQAAVGSVAAAANAGAMPEAGEAIAAERGTQAGLHASVQEDAMRLQTMFYNASQEAKAADRELQILTLKLDAAQTDLDHKRLTEERQRAEAYARERQQEMLRIQQTIAQRSSEDSMFAAIFSAIGTIGGAVAGGFIGGPAGVVAGGAAGGALLRGAAGALTNEDYTGLGNSPYDGPAPSYSGHGLSPDYGYSQPEPHER